MILNENNDNPIKVEIDLIPWWDKLISTLNYEQDQTDRTISLDILHHKDPSKSIPNPNTYQNLCGFYKKLPKLIEYLVKAAKSGNFSAQKLVLSLKDFLDKNETANESKSPVTPAPSKQYADIYYNGQMHEIYHSILDIINLKHFDPFIKKFEKDPSQKEFVNNLSQENPEDMLKNYKDDFFKKSPSSNKEAGIVWLWWNKPDLLKKIKDNSTEFCEINEKFLLHDKSFVLEAAKENSKVIELLINYEPKNIRDQLIIHLFKFCLNKDLENIVDQKKKPFSINNDGFFNLVKEILKNLKSNDIIDLLIKHEKDLSILDHVKQEMKNEIALIYLKIFNVKYSGASDDRSTLEKKYNILLWHISDDQILLALKKFFNEKHYQKPKELEKLYNALQKYKKASKERLFILPEDQKDFVTNVEKATTKTSDSMASKLFLSAFNKKPINVPSKKLEQSF